jgi:hypothetical protein
MFPKGGAMALPRIGDRLGVLYCLTDHAAYVLGGGVYLGREVPPPDIRCCGRIPYSSGLPMPKIQLDQGGIVWGCEAYWAHETVLLSHIGNRPQILIRLEDLRDPDFHPFACAPIAQGHA